MTSCIVSSLLILLFIFIHSLLYSNKWNMYSISFIIAIIIYNYVIVLSQGENLLLQQINKKFQSILRTYMLKMTNHYVCCLRLCKWKFDLSTKHKSHFCYSWTWERSVFSFFLCVCGCFVAPVKILTRILLFFVRFILEEAAFV